VTALPAAAPQCASCWPGQATAKQPAVQRTHVSATAVLNEQKGCTQPTPTGVAHGL
jgi:hypothetical protein